MRVLLTCHDAGGTIPPMIAIGEALVAGRHDVTVLSQPSVGRRAEAAGCTFRPFSTLGDYDHRRSFEEQLDLIGSAIVGPEIGEDLLREPFDVHVVDANLAGALAAAETSGVPTAVLLHSVYATYTDVWFAELWPLLASAVNETRARFGLAPVDGWPGVFAGHDRLLSVVPAEFDVLTATVPPTMRHFGFLVPRSAPAAEAVGFPPGDGATVLVSLGTTSQGQAPMLQSIIAELSSMTVRAVVTTAGQAAIESRSNVTVIDRVPHSVLLPATDVVVTHAGLGTIAASLDAGVPLVCAPYDRDQPLNASRVAALGVGVTVDGDLRRAVERVLTDASFRVRAAELARVSRAEGGAAAVVRELEAMA